MESECLSSSKHNPDKGKDGYDDDICRNSTAAMSNFIGDKDIGETKSIEKYPSEKKVSETPIPPVYEQLSKSRDNKSDC